MKQQIVKWIKGNVKFIILLFMVAVLVLFVIFRKAPAPDYSDILDKVEDMIEKENKTILDTVEARYERIGASEQKVLKLEEKLRASDKEISDLKKKYEKIRISNSNLTTDGLVDKSREYLSN
jgi:hypothetical protein